VFKLLNSYVCSRSPPVLFVNGKLFIHSIFGACMTRDRFQLICSNLHFNNSEAVPNTPGDALFKVRPVLDSLVEKWKETYSLGEHISIDEGMQNWKGRLFFRVYTKEKTIKYGIKSFLFADSRTGYCWNLDIYHKPRKTWKETVQWLLTDRCVGIYHSLFMDNLHNSVELNEFLLDKNVYTVGTFRASRGEPPEISKPGKMNKNEVIARDNGKVMVLSWMDKREVKMISTKHDSSTGKVCHKEKGSVKEVTKPKCVIEYNKYMAGVDRVDQMISYYPCTRKTTNWTKKLFST